jgi:hypothetical protein
MKTDKTMRHALLAPALALAALACTARTDETDRSMSEVTGVPIGQLRGAADVSSTLRVRLLDPGDPRSTSFDVARVAGGALFGLRRQLGAFVPAGTGSEYQGGVPTPFNMMLWHQVLGRVAIAFGDTCASGDAALRFPAYFASGPDPDVATFRLFPSVAEKVAAACAFGGAEADRRAIAGSLWDAVMGVGGSLAAEKAAFVDDVARPGSPLSSDGATPAQRVTSIVLAMLLNPHFLLNK